MIPIVSGLPRSGTSMMMQVLAAGGMPLLVDGLRAADVDNPNGYCEFEPVKKLRTHSGWLNNAEGKAVKVIAQLLHYLPQEYDYKIIFMHRKLEAVLQSQEIMLERQGKSGANLSREHLGKVFSHQLAQVRGFLNRQVNMSTLDVDYAEMVQQPQTYLTQLMRFLDVPLDIEKMKAAIDPGLHRNR
jgi:hypothetical protein